jgi:hypothetical protein
MGKLSAKESKSAEHATLGGNAFGRLVAGINLGRDVLICPDLDKPRDGREDGRQVGIESHSPPAESHYPAHGRDARVLEQVLLFFVANDDRWLKKRTILLRNCRHVSPLPCPKATMRDSESANEAHP